MNDGMPRVVGGSDSSDCVGKTDADFMPADITESYRRDDMALLKTGVPRRNRVERVTNHARIFDGIITTKVSVKNAT